MFGVKVLIREVILHPGESLSIIADDGREVFVLYEEGNLTFCPEKQQHQDVAWLQGDGSWKIEQSKRDTPPA